MCTVVSKSFEFPTKSPYELNADKVVVISLLGECCPMTLPVDAFRTIHVLIGVHNITTFLNSNPNSRNPSNFEQVLTSDTFLEPSIGQCLKQNNSSNKTVQNIASEPASIISLILTWMIGTRINKKLHPMTLMKTHKSFYHCSLDLALSQHSSTLLDRTSSWVTRISSECWRAQGLWVSGWLTRAILTSRC